MYGQRRRRRCDDLFYHFQLLESKSLIEPGAHCLGLSRCLTIPSNLLASTSDSSGIMGTFVATPSFSMWVLVVELRSSY